jgi:chromosome segregation ATPase
MTKRIGNAGSVTMPETWQDAFALMAMTMRSAVEVQSNRHAAEMREVRAELTDARSLITQLTDRLGTEVEARTRLEAALDETGSRIGDFERGIVKLGETVDADRARVVELTDTVDGQRQRVDEQVEQIAAARTEASDALEATARVVGDRLAALDTRLTSHVTEVEARVDEQSRHIEVVRGEILDASSAGIAATREYAGECFNISMAAITTTDESLVALDKRLIARVDTDLGAVNDRVDTLVRSVGNIDEAVQAVTQVADATSGTVRQVLDVQAGWQETVKAVGAHGTLIKAIDGVLETLTNAVELRATTEDLARVSADVNEVLEGALETSGHAEAHAGRLARLDEVCADLRAALEIRATVDVVDQLADEVRELGTAAANTAEHITTATRTFENLSSDITRCVEQIGDAHTARVAGEHAVDQVRTAVARLPVSWLVDREGNLQRTNGVGEVVSLGRVCGTDGKDANGIVSAHVDGGKLILTRGDGASPVSCLLPVTPVPATADAILPSPVPSNEPLETQVKRMRDTDGLKYQIIAERLNIRDTSGNIDARKAARLYKK